MKGLLLASALMLVAVPAFAQYGYHYNKYGTGYWRDDSNDGSPYDNANALGMNDSSPCHGHANILGSEHCN